jgi:HK97 gp10 family phage protein
MASVWVEGIDQLNTVVVVLESSSHRAALDAGKVVRASAHRVESLGKQFCPVDTGNLRNSIGTEFLGYSGNVVAAEIGPTASYGHWVEYGTSRMAPRSFMGPAADIVGPDFAAAMLSLADPLGAP